GDDVANGDIPQGDVRCGGIKRAAVVDVEAVIGLIAKHEIGDRDVGGVAELDAGAAGVDDGPIGRVGAANRDLLQIGAIVSAAVNAGLQDDLVARDCRVEGGGELGGGGDDSLDA